MRKVIDGKGWEINTYNPGETVPINKEGLSIMPSPPKPGELDPKSELKLDVDNFEFQDPQRSYAPIDPPANPRIYRVVNTHDLEDSTMCGWELVEHWPLNNSGARQFLLCFNEKSAIADCKKSLEEAVQKFEAQEEKIKALQRDVELAKAQAASIEKTLVIEKRFHRETCDDLAVRMKLIEKGEAELANLRAKLDKVRSEIGAERFRKIVGE